MGALGIVTTISALVLERRDDIRLLRFAGLSSGGVRTMVVFEAAVVGALGGAGGIVLGVILALTVLAVDRVAFGWTLVTSVPYLALAGTFAAAVAAGALAGLGPGRFAARLRIARGGRAFVSAILAVVVIAGSVTGSDAARATTETAVSGTSRAFAASGDARDVWHVLGRLHAHDGSRFDVAATFFRYSLGSRASDPARQTTPWASRAFDAAALSIVDEDARTTVTGVRVEREGTGFARASRADLDLRVDDWTLRTAPRRASDLRLHVAEGANVLDLSLERRTSPIWIGRCDGCPASGTASPRLAARGILTLGDHRIAVRGTFWVDRESATSAKATTSAARTERFTIQLDDGRAVVLRATPGSTAAQGVFVTSGGIVTPLGAGDAFVFNPLRTSWRNARGIPYPSLFEAVVPRAHLDLALVPAVQAQEIDPSPRGRPFYSGALDVERANPGPRDAGTGFVELTGFADADARP
jgi:predicted secreted hydrolase